MNYYVLMKIVKISPQIFGEFANVQAKIMNFAKISPKKNFFASLNIKKIFRLFFFFFKKKKRFIFQRIYNLNF